MHRCTLVLLSFVTLAVTVDAGAQTSSPSYANSSEYKQMLEEVRRPAPSPALIAVGHLPAPDKSLVPVVHDDAAALTITTADAEFAWSKPAASLHWRNLRSQAEWTITLPAMACGAGATAVPAIRRKGNAWTVAPPPACTGPTFILHPLTGSLASFTVSGTVPDGVELNVMGSDPVFGLGERFWQSSLAGTKMDVRPEDHFGEPGGHNWSYVAIPLVYSTSGLGLYADTSFTSKFSGSDAGTSFSLKVASQPVTFYLFSEADPKAVLTAYTGITGSPADVPYWTFGPWITALQGKGPVLDIAARIRNEGIPASALWVFDDLDEPSNIGWPFWFGSYYGSSREFTDLLHGQGFKVLSYVHPYVRQQDLPYTLQSPLYEKGVREKLLVTGADGKPVGPRFEGVTTGNVDFTNPAAVNWWQGMITSAVRDQGFDGWMEDFGEWISDTDHGANATGKTLSMLYPLLYHKVTDRVAHGINPEVVAFARSGAPGTQAFSPALWGGDQFANWSRDLGLPSVVTAGITAGMSGFSNWGPDINSTGDSRELWMRWVEFGALTPIMRDHVWDKPARAIHIWSDPDATAHFRSYAILHSSLLPYFATYAAEAHRTGVPIMRHTALEFPTDPHSATAEYQYFLGREMLVAPVVSPTGERTLYAPAGEWINFWDGNSYRGGKDITVPAPVWQIPILVRAGSVLPFLPDQDTARINWEDPHLLEGPLVWRAYLSAMDDSAGDFQLPNGTAAHFQQHDGTATVQGTSNLARDYEVIVRTKLAPTDVLLDGKPFPHYSKAAGTNRPTQWWWNPNSAEVHMLFRASNFEVQLKGVTTTQYPK